MSHGNFMYQGQFSNFGKDKRKIEVTSQTNQGDTILTIKESYAEIGSCTSTYPTLPPRLAFLLPKNLP